MNSLLQYFSPTRLSKHVEMKQPYITLIKSLTLKTWPGTKGERMEMKGCIGGAIFMSNWQHSGVDQDCTQRQSERLG